jgi:hypothetical protein
VAQAFQPVNPQSRFRQTTGSCANNRRNIEKSGRLMKNSSRAARGRPDDFTILNKIDISRVFQYVRISVIGYKGT